MRFGLIIFTFVFAAAVQAQLIVGTIFAIEIVLDIVSEVAAEEVIAEIATSAEIEMSKAAAGGLQFEATNADVSATVVSGVVNDQIFGAESAAFFTMGGKSLSQVAGKKFLTSNFIWKGLKISEDGGRRIFEPVITGTIKNGFKLEGDRLVSDGTATIIKRVGDPGAQVHYGHYMRTGGYGVRIKDFMVRPRIASE